MRADWSTELSSDGSGQSAIGRAVHATPQTQQLTAGWGLHTTKVHLAVVDGQQQQHAVVALRIADAPRVVQRLGKQVRRLCSFLARWDIHSAHDRHCHLSKYVRVLGLPA